MFNSFTISAIIQAVKKLVLLDGNALLHRAYHALPNSFTDAKGNPTNAVYGFASMLVRILEEVKPNYIVSAFDSPGATFRHEKFKSYKEGRPKMDNALVVQLPKVKELLRELEIPYFEISGYEGEDLLASIINQAYKRNKSARELDSIIVTGDRDTFQLINKNVRVLAPVTGFSKTILYDESKVKSDIGVSPSQIPDYKGLRGDPSDKIPGVFGIGEKTAVALLRKYESIENIYDHLGDIDQKISIKLAKDAEMAVLSKDLATINTEAPLKFTLTESALPKDYKKKLIKIFTHYGFLSLVRRLGGRVTDAKKVEMSKNVTARKKALKEKIAKGQMHLI